MNCETPDCETVDALMSGGGGPLEIVLLLLAQVVLLCWLISGRWLPSAGSPMRALGEAQDTPGRSGREPVLRPSGGMPDKPFYVDYVLGQHLFRVFRSGRVYKQDNDTGLWNEVLFDGE